MTVVPSRTELLTRWRRGLFYIWIGAALIAVFTAMIGGPLASTDGANGTSAIALIAPVAMAVFLLSGLTWLALLVLSHRSRYTSEPPPG